MSGFTEEDQEFNVIHSLNEYADRHPEFNAKFLDSVMKFYERTGFVTMDQINVLNKISKELLSKSEKDN